MKHALTILAMLLPLSAWSIDSNALAQAVNAHWTNKNYQALIETIDRALQEDPHDVFALCLKHKYYMTVEEDFDKAKESSAKLVTEVDSRIENAKGAVYDLAKALSTADRPSNTPPSPLIDEKRMNYRHKAYPDKFPFIEMYLWFSSNLDKYGEEKKSQHAPPAGRGEAPRP